VKLDIPRLVANLSKEDARDTSEAEVTQWLDDAGFSRDGEWWLVSEADLGQVDPSEVLEVAPDAHDDPGTST
jgi:hypothetical protein